MEKRDVELDELQSMYKKLREMVNPHKGVDMNRIWHLYNETSDRLACLISAVLSGDND